MILKDIFKDINTNIFIITNDEDDNELNWILEPTNLELIPDDENHYIVRAKEIRKNKTIDCFIDVIISERISELVIKKSFLGSIKIQSIYELSNSVIPVVPSDCFGDYELYYSKENPQIGIDVLKSGLGKANNKNIVAEDLGYILRDENRNEEAIEAFLLSEKHDPSSVYTYLELSYLYEKIGLTELKDQYFKKFTENGGKIINP